MTFELLSSSISMLGLFCRSFHVEAAWYVMAWYVMLDTAQLHNERTMNKNFFYIRIFFRRHQQLTGQQGKGGDHFLFHSTTSTHSQTFRHLFVTLHVRWLSHIFNHNVCIYHTATQWDFTTLLNYHLIDWWCEVYFSLFTWWFDTRFLLEQSWYRKLVDSNLHRLSPLYHKQTN